MPPASARVRLMVRSPPVDMPEQVGWNRLVLVRVSTVTDLAAPSTTSVPMATSGTHSLAVQAGSVKQALSWQSVRPLPSSSLPLLQTSRVAGLPADSVTHVAPAVPVQDSATTP